MLQRPGGFSGSRAPYVPSVAASRGVYRSSYIRPRTGSRFGPRSVAPIVPAGRAPGGPGMLAAILGPIGGLTGCFCCLNTIGVWGLFITSIPLTVFMSRWLRDYKTRNGLNGAEELIVPHLLLCVLLLFSILYTFMRRT